MFLVFVHAFLAFAVVALFAMPLRKIAYYSGIVDQPGGRKQHAKAIPPIGGLIVFTVFMLYGFFSGLVDLVEYWPLYMALILLLTSGALDDQFHIPAKIKLCVHIAAAALITFWGNVEAAYLGNLFGLGVLWAGMFSYPFTIVAVVLLINAMNLMDGMDGLAGGVSFVMFSWMAFIAFISGWYAYAFVLLLLIACLAGFLVFNMRNPWRRSASLFLGDAGSMSLGLCLAWFGVLLARGPSTPMEPIAVAWVLGFPVFDICAQFYRRVCEGKDPFSPDRGHFHHHFIDAGVSVRYAAPIIISIVALMGLIGCGGVALGVHPAILTIGWVALLLLHIVLSRKPERYVRLIQRFCAKKNIHTA